MSSKPAAVWSGLLEKQGKSFNGWRPRFLSIFHDRIEYAAKSGAWVWADTWVGVPLA